MAIEQTSLKPGWAWVKFGDVVRLNTERCADPAIEGIERYVGLEHIEPEDLRIRRWGLVADGTTFTNRFRPGQVLFGKRRAYQRKVAVADFDGVCSGDIYVFEPKNDRLLPELLPFLCQTEAFFEYAVGTSAGSLSPRTNWTQLANFDVALPPLGEQRRVTEILLKSEALWTCYQEALLKSRELSSSLISYLLDSPTAGIDMDSLTIGQLGLNDESVLKTGPFGSKLKTSYFRPSGVPIISIGSLQEDGLNSSEFFYLKPDLLRDFEEYQTQEGDIVFSRVADVGRCYLITELDAGFIISSNLIRIRVDQSIIRPFYLWLLLKYSINIRRQIAGMTTQAAGRLLINTKTMDKLIFMVPDLAFQDHIISQYQDVRNATNRLISRFNTSKHLFYSMREQIFADMGV